MEPTKMVFSERQRRVLQCVVEWRGAIIEAWEDGDYLMIRCQIEEDGRFQSLRLDPDLRQALLAILPAFPVADIHVNEVIKEHDAQEGKKE